MTNLIDTAFSFPAIVLTVSTIFFLGFWIVTTVLGTGINSLDDFDLDFDSDVDTDVELDGGGSGSVLQSSLEFLGLTGMPILLALNLLSLFAWAVAMIAMTVIGDEPSGIGGTLIGVVVLIGAVVVGGFITGRIGDRVSGVFRPPTALRKRELVGKVCTVTTDKVTADFGQAEVRDAEGASLLVQIRCVEANTLHAGDQALIFDLDEDGTYTVSPDIGL